MGITAIIGFYGGGGVTTIIRFYGSVGFTAIMGFYGGGVKYSNVLLTTDFNYGLLGM